MDRRRCFIAGAGEYSGRLYPADGDFVIAADGGYLELINRGIAPDLVVGDFDSLGSLPEHPDIVRHPPEKNDTDMRLAVMQGLKRGYNTFIIDGGLGGRLDHTIANIQTLTFIAQEGARGFLLGKDVCITAISNGSISFLQGAKGNISVFCAGEITRGVTLEGLKYPLNDAVLSSSYPLGVSNEFTGAPAIVTALSGTLTVMWYCGLEYLAGL